MTELINKNAFIKNVEAAQKKNHLFFENRQKRRNFLTSIFVRVEKLISAQYKAGKPEKKQ